MQLKRHNKSFINVWWNNIDHFILTSLAIIIAFSAIMVATASPAIADRIGLESFYFIKRQIFYLLAAIIIMFIISNLEISHIRNLAIIGFVVCLVSLVVVLFVGVEVKGAKRWLYIFGFSFQPSEFIKPLFAVITGLILSLKQHNDNFHGFRLSAILYVIVVVLLILQPDFGMVVTVSVVWAGQLFLAGLSTIFIIIAGFSATSGLIGAYLFLPHVTKRINSFIGVGKNENYQIKKSLEAFVNGGLYGKGPGEGTVKQYLPDSHTDFIFAVMGEELGIITCFIVISLFAMIVIRGFLRITQENDFFIIYAASGLLIQFGMQAIINMSVTLHLLPTKGMTLPFISYGGSSMLAIALEMGIILAMTKKKIWYD